MGKLFYTLSAIFFVFVLYCFILDNLKNYPSFLGIACFVLGYLTKKEIEKEKQQKPDKDEKASS